MLGHFSRRFGEPSIPNLCPVEHPIAFQSVYINIEFKVPHLKVGHKNCAVVKLVSSFSQADISCASGALRPSLTCEADSFNLKKMGKIRPNTRKL